MLYPNVLLIVMDTVRADHLSCYGYERRTSPNIDQIAVEGTLYECAISPAIWTLPSHISLFTGKYPSEHAVIAPPLYLPEHVPTLAEILHSRGYRTLGISCNNLVSHATGLSRGFGRFQEITEWLPDRGANIATETAMQWLSCHHGKDQPFFLFLNYLEAHLPYISPPAYQFMYLGANIASHEVQMVNKNAWSYLSGQVVMSEGEFEILCCLYDGALSYVDYNIGRLVRYLRQLDILDSTVVFITSDHGENIGEHELMDHQFCLYHTLISVPLIVRAPSRFPASVRIKNPVQTLHIFATIVNVLDIRPPEPLSWLADHSLLPERLSQSSPPFAVSEHMNPQLHLFAKKGFPVRAKFDRKLRAAFDGHHKFIWSSDDLHELYDLEQDPHELDNLVDDKPYKARAIRKLLEDWSVTIKATGFDAEQENGERDQAILARLHALGYID